jgi:hypothetical protein
MTRLIKSELKMVSLYLEGQYLECIVEKRVKRILKELEEWKEIEELLKL